MWRVSSEDELLRLNSVAIRKLMSLSSSPMAGIYLS